MTPDDVLLKIIRPTLDIFGGSYVSPEAELMLLAIQQQEDIGCTRCQIGGPARGLWQMEPNGVYGVLHHKRTSVPAAILLAHIGLSLETSRLICAEMQDNDTLACGFARLLLLTIPRQLPAVGDSDEAWSQYIEAWRPGKPRHDDWKENHQTAKRTVEKWQLRDRTISPFV